jgi:hypothetical protein
MIILLEKIYSEIIPKNIICLIAKLARRACRVSAEGGPKLGLPKRVLKNLTRLNAGGA